MAPTGYAGSKRSNASRTLDKYMSIVIRQFVMGLHYSRGVIIVVCDWAKVSAGRLALEAAELLLNGNRRHKVNPSGKRSSAHSSHLRFVATVAARGLGRSMVSARLIQRLCRG